MVPRTMLDSWFHSQSIPIYYELLMQIASAVSQGEFTLLAGFVFSFSKILWDWAFVAELMS